MAHIPLFQNYKYCENCGRPLFHSHEGTLCPFCEEQQLFHKVKEYIRSDDVTEYDVATHFGIPLSRVKQWIDEGRIEYKDNTQTVKLIKSRCQNCGAIITFGTLCSKCLRTSNMAGYEASQKQYDNHMRFLDQEENEKFHH